MSQAIIESLGQWLEILEDRNLTVHTYHEETAQNVFECLPKYLDLLQSLYKQLEKNNSN